MALDKEEAETFNQMISMFVTLYKTIWNEVEKQFQELPKEERHKIFSIIAPSIIQTLTMAPDEYEDECESEAETSRKTRNKRK
jgi:uncharacterized protein YfbU (UPF0304 family)